MKFKNDDLVNVKDMNTIVEVKLPSNNYIPKGVTKRLDKKHYVNTETGEVKEYKSKNDKSSSRKNNPESLARTGRTTKDLIVCNFVDKTKTQYITLTYDEHVFDYKQSYNDFKAFIKTLRRHYGSDNEVQYIVIQEEHYDSSLHFHCILYWDKHYPKDMVKNLSDLWDKGSAIHKPIRENKDILFIAAYLTSGFFDKCKKANKYDIAKTKDEKAAIKNVRLENLPAYYRAAKHSKNMLTPIKDTMYFEDAVRRHNLEEAFSERTFEKTIKGVHIKNEYNYYVV